MWFKKFLDLIYRASFGKRFTIGLPSNWFDQSTHRSVSSLHIVL